MRLFSVLVVGGALALAGCGGGGTKTVVQTVTSPAATTGTTPPVPTETTPAEPAFASCDDKGINNERVKEGTCRDSPGSTRYTVVNRGSTLKLDELNATVENTALTKTLTSDIGTTRANGMFYVITLRVKNKLPDPTTFDDSHDQTALTIGEKHYSESFEAENNPGGAYGSSFVWADDDIQPDAEHTGTVIFDVPNSAVPKLTSRKAGPNLLVVNFSDIDNENVKRAGILRLYH